MSSATAGLAEVYVMKKLYKEKLKNASELGGHERKSCSGGSGGGGSGGFFKMFKKSVHPTSVDSDKVLMKS